MTVSAADRACYPVSFEDDPPRPGATRYLADPAVALVVRFFQEKGLSRLKDEDRAEEWYADWIAYQARHGLYASLLTPRRHGGCFSARKLTRLLEVGAYFSPAHTYSLHVSFLGIFPILISANEVLEREAVERLAEGGLFAFGVSEKAHGSDLFGNEFAVREDGPGRWVADGSKYYIGNANEASIVSVLARDGGATGRGKRAPFVFFALRPGEAPACGEARKIRTIGVRTAFVGEFEVAGHALGEDDVIARGRAAWDAMFHTVDFGKFFLGFGAIGICEHAFVEALEHLRTRTLYGDRAIGLPHIRRTVALARARLVAMKFYALRALDYLEAAGPDERRYLLYNAVQKARVSTEGVRVIAMLSECVGARGVESETYFESALRDAQLIPGLEGSTHINFGLTAQFVAPYFAAGEGEGPAPPPRGRDDVENPHWFAAPDRNAKSVRFRRFDEPYGALPSVRNVGLFVRQAGALRDLTTDGVERATWADTELRIALGRCFSIVAYGQLVAETCAALATDRASVSLIFHALVQDLSAEALSLAALLPVEGAARALLAAIVAIPETDGADFEPDPRP